jgi:hypothetical protein
MLAALVGMITAEIDSLNAAVAVLNEARDAAPCYPSRSGSEGQIVKTNNNKVPSTTNT